MFGREEFGLVAEVPLANAGGGVSLIPEDFGDGSFPGIEAFAGIWKENPFLIFVDVHVDATGITAGKETGP
jgi:hypothetical protein